MVSKATTAPPERLSAAQHPAFYDIPLSTPDAPSLASARCPRCCLPLILRHAVTEVTFDLGLGEALEYLQHAQDMLRAATGAIEATVHP
jgi:hypothetical protein